MTPTPEERAAAIEIVREIAKESPADGLLLKHSIAAAIRAAVDAERERCAQVADEATVKELERFKDCKDNPEVGWEERDMRSYAIDTLAELAARIREGKT